MSAKRWIPGAHEVVAEAVSVLAGAVLAAWVVGQLPALKNWIKKQWDGVPLG